jgi:hypothetical protein
MPKYKRLLMPAVLAVGTILLTACDIGADIGASADGKQSTSTTAGSTPADSTAEEDAAGGDTSEVETADEDTQLGYTANPPEGGCGDYGVGNGSYSRLIPDEGSLGYVKCDEAFEVLNDFSMLDDQIEIPEEGLNFNFYDPWHCDITAVADGVTVGVSCFTPAIPSPADPILARFHSEPM